MATCRYKQNPLVVIRRNGVESRFLIPLGHCDRASVVIKHILQFGGMLESAVAEAVALHRGSSVCRREIDAAIFKCDLAIRRCVPNGYQAEGWTTSGAMVLDRDGREIGRFAGASADASNTLAKHLAEFPQLLSDARHARKLLEKARSTCSLVPIERSKVINAAVSMAIHEVVGHAS